MLHRLLCLEGAPFVPVQRSVLVPVGTLFCQEQQVPRLPGVPPGGVQVVFPEGLPRVDLDLVHRPTQADIIGVTEACPGPTFAVITACPTAKAGSEA